jgi:hypothetical protein
MSLPFPVSKAHVEQMSRPQMKEWIETCVARLGIPVRGWSPHGHLTDAEFDLNGEYEHVTIAYDAGSYAVWASSPYVDFQNIIDGEGDIAEELRQAREFTLPTHPQNR